MNNSIEGKVKPHFLAKHIGQIKQKYKARRMEKTGLRIRQADLLAVHLRKRTNKLLPVVFPSPGLYSWKIKLLCS